ncbi:MAG: hypothetical protein P8Y47_12745, partial [Alphaproteobacteria bacterium]
MRHVFGVLGVIAATILLCVSAAMNWQYGFSLGKTPFDSHIFGAASIAADGMKALMPFFIFSAYRNRNWSQALGGSALWAVCIIYAMTSALGFSALNRSDTSGSRAAQVAQYKDLRGEMDRIKQQQSWLKKHRSTGAVSAEIEAIKQNYRWTTSAGCTDVTLPESREVCTKYHKLNAELAAAKQDKALEERKAVVSHKLATMEKGGGVQEADPQAAIISNLSGMDITKVETGMTILVMLLVELGSSLGLYVSTSTWRIEDQVPAPRPEQPKVVEIINPMQNHAHMHMHTPTPRYQPQIQIQPASQLALPKSDIETYFETRISQDDGASVTALSLYDDYCEWCEIAQRQPV